MHKHKCFISPLKYRVLNDLPGLCNPAYAQQVNSKAIDPSLSLSPSTGLQHCDSDFPFDPSLVGTSAPSNIFHLNELAKSYVHRLT